MKHLHCPACGSDKLKIEQVTEVRNLTLGKDFSYVVPIQMCEVCGEEFDADINSDHVIEAAIEKAKKDLAVSLIEELQKKGLKLSYVERALELPQRTISSKWRKSISASGLALLRIVATMPWVITIADNKFTPSSINHEVSDFIFGYSAPLNETTISKSDLQLEITGTDDTTFFYTNLKTGT